MLTSPERAICKFIRDRVGTEPTTFEHILYNIYLKRRDLYKFNTI